MQIGKKVTMKRKADCLERDDSSETSLEIISHVLRRYGEDQLTKLRTTQQLDYDFDLFYMKKVNSIKLKTLKNITTLGDGSFMTSNRDGVYNLEIVDDQIIARDNFIPMFSYVDKITPISNKKKFICETTRCVNVYDFEDGNIHAEAKINNIEEIIVLDHQFILIETHHTFSFYKISHEELSLHSQLKKIHFEDRAITQTNISPDGGIIMVTPYIIFTYHAYPQSCSTIQRTNGIFSHTFQIISNEKIACISNINSNYCIEIWNIKKKICENMIQYPFLSGCLFS